MNISTAVTTEPEGLAMVTVDVDDCIDQDGILRISETVVRVIADQALAAARDIGVRALPQLANYWELTDSTRTVTDGTAVYTLTYTWQADDFGPAL